MTILEWTRSLREYWKILEHMTLDDSTISIQEGRGILMGILDGRELSRYRVLTFKLAASPAPQEQEQSELLKIAVADEPVQKRFFA